jgi:hypothetical protein
MFKKEDFLSDVFEGVSDFFISFFAIILSMAGAFGMALGIISGFWLFFGQAKGIFFSVLIGMIITLIGFFLFFCATKLGIRF